ncbi:alpha-ribazole phosphatase family protein [Azonexus sp.]|jgi:alpha-ribazole phosphatase|uniref:alpha-ribazole phosphatase family protein n=1 Tax=Azonexus sp. TaxID=1872668 RepID=UPI0028361525|nr:alpha-ribazole phosphatase family protein [Azonexus sp.]MDR1995400.1 alpha-ribazole phosphatase family protein [Azonexus sp.]
MILHLIRHPPPRVAQGVCYGAMDVPAEPAAVFAAALRADLPPGLPLWSSPLQRCHELAAALHPAPIFDERLREMDFGAWEGRRWADIPRAELDAWAADVDGYVPPGGESARQLQRRVLDFVTTLTVTEAVLVTHAGVIRSLYAHANGRPIADCLDVRPAFGSLTRLVLA